jgi:hypothetical protein
MIAVSAVIVELGHDGLLNVSSAVAPAKDTLKPLSVVPPAE